MTYFKRDPAGVPLEIQRIMARRLFPDLFPKEADDARRLTEGDQPDADHSHYHDPDSGDRRRHVVNVLNKLFEEVGE